MQYEFDSTCVMITCTISRPFLKLYLGYSRLVYVRYIYNYIIYFYNLYIYIYDIFIYSLYINIVYIYIYIYVVYIYIYYIPEALQALILKVWALAAIV